MKILELYTEHIAYLYFDSNGIFGKNNGVFSSLRGMMIIVGVGNFKSLLFYECLKFFMRRIQRNTVKLNGRVRNINLRDVGLFAGIIGKRSDLINDAMRRVNLHAVFIDGRNISLSVIFLSAHQTESLSVFREVKTIDVVADPEFKVGFRARNASWEEKDHGKQQDRT